MERKEGKKLEEHDPGATRDEVMDALKKATRPVQDKDSKSPDVVQQPLPKYRTNCVSCGHHYQSGLDQIRHDIQHIAEADSKTDEADSLQQSSEQGSQEKQPTPHS